ncbi:MAG: UDP-N-acetylmuramoyl-L-alanine--D-glutamate ligase [Candidatus Promineifilaceae bacterium]|jgi:UDP-N-acetylmuramoylalanine--D-glutamate ligase
MNKDLTGKQIVILGFARQGKAFAQFAAQNGAKVIISDLRSPDQLQDSMDALQDLEIEYVLGNHPLSLLEGTDLLVVSGGVPVNIPLVQAARRQNITVSNDSQEFATRCPAGIVGITGSAGKSTTTALLGEIARAAGRRTWVGGNIGRPLIADLEEMQPGDVVVQELSSFQLEIWQYSPPVAAVLNITPNHLDRHESMAAYSHAKANILRYQDETGITVLSADNPGAMELAPLTKGRLRLFSIEREVRDGAFVRDGFVWLRSLSEDQEKAVISMADIKLRGLHNLSNVCAAVTLADSIDIPISAMAVAITQFNGVPHRLELVKTINGVQYVNDSIATAPERALAALASYDEPLILLAGGKDKNMVWDAWASQVTKQVKHVILFGALAEMLMNRLEQENKSQGGSLQISRVEDLPSAVHLAAAVAEEGDIVLLSPGGTSYDAYQDFEERGRHFRMLVTEIDTDQRKAI